VFTQMNRKYLSGAAIFVIVVVGRIKLTIKNNALFGILTRKDKL
jgi:hypothetical protein